MRNIKSVGDMQVQAPCVVKTDLGKRRQMFTYERFLLTLHRTLGTPKTELRATKSEIARELGMCGASINRASARLRRGALVEVRPIADRRCKTICNAYRLTEYGIRVAQAIENTIVDDVGTVGADKGNSHEHEPGQGLPGRR